MSAPQPGRVNTDAGIPSLLGWLVVLAGVGGFALWAAFAPLDKGVPLTGTVTAQSHRKAIQYQPGGTVREILVRDGDAVRAGQVLVRMDDVLLRAQAGMARGQHAAALAAQARLAAERDGTAMPAAGDGDAALALQAEMLRARRDALRSELGAIGETIAGIKLQERGLRAARASKERQRTLLAQQLAHMRALARDGFVAPARLLEMEGQQAQLDGQIAEDGGTLGRVRRQASELALRAAQRRHDYQNEVRRELLAVQRDTATLASRLAAYEHELDGAQIRAPAAGTVVALAVFARGAVVAPGARLMEIVPSGDALVVEGQLPVHLADKVQPGLAVELVFSAFNSARTPRIPGQVTQVGADRGVDERTGQPFYALRVTVTPQGRRLIAANRLAIRPGMPVDLFVRTGERTLASYLLKPVLDRMGSAMGEE